MSVAPMLDAAVPRGPTRAVYLHPWDLDGVDPLDAARELRTLGFDACSLALAYHGGRVVLPRGRRTRVRELDPGAVYFAADPARYAGLQLRPHAAPEAALVPPFLAACADVGLAVRAWTVVCHNDRLGAAHPDCCVENLYGDRYPYALCPAHPEVRRYAVALCADVASIAALERLELEALGFLGFEHASLHDKAGVPLDAAARWLLSVCTCRWCRQQVGEPLDTFAARARGHLDAYLDAPSPDASGTDLRATLHTILGAPTVAQLLAGRRAIVATLLDEVRAVIGALHLNVRVAPDPLFVGGKSALDWAELAGRADSATVSYFGVPLERMRQEVARLPAPAERPLPIDGAFVFHGPDCASASDVRARLALLDAARLDGVAAYCLGLAAPSQLTWLADALAAPAAPAAPAPLLEIR